MTGFAPSPEEGCTLGATARADLARVLDGVARRLLSEQGDGDAPASPPTGLNNDARDGSPDRCAALV